MVCSSQYFCCVVEEEGTVFQTIAVKLGMSLGHCNGRECLGHKAMISNFNHLFFAVGTVQLAEKDCHGLGPRSTSRPGSIFRLFFL